MGQSQQFYNVGLEVEVLRVCPIYEKRGSTTVVANLRAKSKVTILLWDPAPDPQNPKTPSDWYLIKSESGLLGWMREKDFQGNLDVAYAD